MTGWIAGLFGGSTAHSEDGEAAATQDAVVATTANDTGSLDEPED